MKVEEFFNLGSGIVTLCGSTKFFEQCLEINRILTFKNWIVLMCGSWGHSYHKEKQNDLIERDFEQVKKLHYHKILISNAIVVVSDSSGYYGESTKAEIAFAKYRNIPVFYYDGINLTGETNDKIPHELEDNSLIDNFEKVNGTLGF